MHLTDYILYVLVFVVDSEQLLFKFHTQVVFEVFYKVLEVFCYDLFKFCRFNTDQAKVNVKCNFILRLPVGIYNFFVVCSVNLLSHWGTFNSFLVKLLLTIIIVIVFPYMHQRLLLPQASLPHLVKQISELQLDVCDVLIKRIQVQLSLTQYELNDSSYLLLQFAKL